MPLHQELRESVIELSKGCQLKVQAALQGTPGMGNDQDHKPLQTGSLFLTDELATPKLQKTKGTEDRWGGESEITEGFLEKS